MLYVVLSHFQKKGSPIVKPLIIQNPRMEVIASNPVFNLKTTSTDMFVTDKMMYKSYQNDNNIVLIKCKPFAKVENFISVNNILI